MGGAIQNNEPDKDEKEQPHRSKNFKACHKRTGNNSGGACLWGHNDRYSKSSCSYRWQAHTKAKRDNDIYHRYQKKSGSKLQTLGHWTDKGFYPAGYTPEIDFPNKNQWSPNKLGNFEKSWIVPYWHNAHHLIPKSMLINEITTAAGNDPDVSIIIQQALLNAQYNINEDINMIILPQDQSVANLLSLPRHISLSKGGEHASHTSYDKGISQSKPFRDAIKVIITKELKKVISDYKKAVKSAKNKSPKKHPKVKAKANKTQLEDLSNELYNAITGKTPGKFFDPGEPLDSIDLKSILA